MKDFTTGPRARGKIANGDATAYGYMRLKEDYMYHKFVYVSPVGVAVTTLGCHASVRVPAKKIKIRILPNFRGVEPGRAPSLRIKNRTYPSITLKMDGCHQCQLAIFVPMRGVFGYDTGDGQTRLPSKNAIQIER